LQKLRYLIAEEDGHGNEMSGDNLATEKKTLVALSNVTGIKNGGKKRERTGKILFPCPQKGRCLVRGSLMVAWRKRLKNPVTASGMPIGSGPTEEAGEKR